MRKLLTIIAAVLLAFIVAAPSASAASPHFKKGGSPTCTITSTSSSSTSTTCKASLSGLGNGDLLIEVTVKGFAVYQCQNGGGNIAPGQNKVLVGPVTEPTLIPGDQIKNGNVSFVTDPAVLSAPATVSAADAGCPNNNWTGVNPKVTVTSITMDITQGTLLFHCTASNPNGLSGTVALTC